MSRSFPMPQAFVSPDRIRSLFTEAMSQMYRAEVPQYGTLIELVADVNAGCLESDPDLRDRLTQAGELERIDVERHGAIRLGTADELFTIRRLFAVMGMQPVGYYDLSVAGVPVHSTSFRPIDEAALNVNPFRVFTSLLRLELIEDEGLRGEAEAILAKRRIYTPSAVALIERHEQNGGLSEAEATEFVAEALETFRWHGEATVSAETYKRLHDAHRLIADVVSFKGPHINHLTPRTLDIDAVQARMPERGITPKAVIEGPPRRHCDILLRQTSFKALEETIAFSGDDGAIQGTHTARFGEIEQRGVALTAKGRVLYDQLLASVRGEVQVGAGGAKAGAYDHELAARFKALPDSWDELRRADLAFFRYSATPAGVAAAGVSRLPGDPEALIAKGYLAFTPIVYEDFLPVSAAGIFQSNLGTDQQQNYATRSNRDAFEAALGATVQDELALYAERQAASLDSALAALGLAGLPLKTVA
ncbi:2-oxoadipate dioxygenase/decarboxylase HglS [Rhizobium leguminosarum]|uniref:2-oxoadipate dioxygenase/decarboxylase n=1 Tax=Rhizobium leguminosarum TaxID=384 RepID=A0A4Q8YCV5_RHILE|nr:VOC family protein [Rhizobium leguminosarum]TAV91585.1 VOC family protein [Rhizobium leguminosarum]TAV96192.1 VOC family protein [Rhizobium leguminosarum]TAW37271.1 VOC family protein [Rhizobium leguminosarum]TAX32112.1 VOC family protein [Rhizobium leguminosarum]TAX74094.1 VOC family protein [Rhizobium leguminosarum]